MTALVWLQASAPVLGVWPATATGWASLLVATAALVSILYGYAKGIAKLNGYGERLQRQEGKVERLSAQATEFERQVARVTDAQERLLDRIGAAERSAEGCNANVTNFGIEIGSKVDDLRRTMEREARSAGERLVAVETKLDLIVGGGEHQPERRVRPPRGTER